MNRKTLGKSTLSVTTMGLGLAALGRPGYINMGHATDLHQTYDVANMEAHAHTVLDAAWAAGIRYYDAARSYGLAERFLSGWLNSRQVDPTAVTVGSKWGYTYTADWQVDAEKHEVKEHSLAVLQRQTGESRALLGRYLRLYQIHSATLESGVLQNKTVLSELSRLKQEEGLKIGLSLSGPQQAQTLQRALGIQHAGGSLLFDVVQATWNLLEPAAGPALAEAHAAGLGIIVKEAVANGRLTARNDSPELAALRQMAVALETTVDALALAAVLAQPWADVVLSGAATPAQLQQNVRAHAVPWTPAVAAKLQGLVEPSPIYWETRARLPWN